MRWLLILIFSLFATLAHSSESLKQQAYKSIQKFFQVPGRILEYRGKFVDTPTEYGNLCRIIIDFSTPGAEYLTLLGEYSPRQSIGDGIYFNLAEESFTAVTSEHDRLILEQQTNDSFSTGTHTRFEITKSAGTIDARLIQTNSLLFITDTRKKRCVAATN